MTKQEAAFRQAVADVDAGVLSCVALQGDRRVAAENARGIGPALRLYEQGLLQKAAVADKIVGKAAAMLFVLGGATRVYGAVMSREALTYLRAKGIPAEYGVCTEQIVNRIGTGGCPMEETVASVTDEWEAYRVLKAKWLELSGKNMTSK